MIVGNLFKPYSLAGEFDRPRSKLIWPAIISGAAGLIGGLISNASNNANNHTQIDLARENNAFNERMFDRQIAYNWDMFNAENEYNDAESQVQRYMEAGINPSLAMEGQSAATAQGGSVSPPSASSLPTTQPFNWTSTFQNLGDIYYNVERRQLELERMKLDNTDKEDEVFHNNLMRSKERSIADQMYRKYFLENEDKYRSNRYNERIEPYLEERVSQEMRREGLLADYQSITNAAANVDYVMKQFDKEHQNQMFDLQVAELSARIQNLMMDTQKSSAEIKKIWSENLEVIARTYGINYNNRLNDELWDSTVLARQYENWSSYRENRFNAQSWMGAFNEYYGDPHRRATLGRGLYMKTGAGLNVPRVTLGR